MSTDAEQCVSWVRSLPSEWTTALERMTLLHLAIQGGEHHGDRESLARAIGTRTSQLVQVVHELRTPTPVRPALVRVLERCPPAAGCAHRPGEALALHLAEHVSGAASP